MGTADFDLHGIVGVRLLDAGRSDVARVTRQLGPLQSPLRRPPDICVRFVDHIDTPPLTYVGRGDGGFTDDGFYVLRGKGSVASKARIPFAQVGGELELVCERAMPAVPLLLALVNYAALAKGVLPVHASAFTTTPAGTGVLATGWAKGGKTEALLAFMQRGAHYVGDEWVYLTSDGRMFGVPEPIRLWFWQLRQLPELMGTLSRSQRARLQVLHGAAGFAGRVGSTASAPASVARRAAPLLERQAYAQVPPVTLFGAEAVTLQGRVDALLLTMSWESPSVRVDPVEPAEVAGRMAASLAAEREPFMAYYRQFRYAFPAAVSPVVEEAPHRERQLLELLVAGRTDAYAVRHPYPVDIASLYEPILSVLPEHRLAPERTARR